MWSCVLAAIIFCSMSFAWETRTAHSNLLNLARLLSTKSMSRLESLYLRAFLNPCLQVESHCISVCARWVTSFLAVEKKIHLGLSRKGRLYERIVGRKDQRNGLKAELAGSVLKARPLIRLTRWQMHALLPLKHSTQLPELALFSKASPLHVPIVYVLQKPLLSLAYF